MTIARHTGVAFHVLQLMGIPYVIVQDMEAVISSYFGNGPFEFA